MTENDKNEAPKWIPATLAIGNSILLIPALWTWTWSYSVFAVPPTVLGTLLLVFYFFAWLGRANGHKFSWLWLASITFNIIILLLARYMYVRLEGHILWSRLLLGILTWVTTNIFLSLRALLHIGIRKPQ